MCVCVLLLWDEISRRLGPMALGFCLNEGGGGGCPPIPETDDCLVSLTDPCQTATPTYSVLHHTDPELYIRGRINANKVVVGRKENFAELKKDLAFHTRFLCSAMQIKKTPLDP